MLEHEIQEPVVLDGDGGADIFRTVADAERYVERVDIEAGVYTAYDAAGRLLNLWPAYRSNYGGKLSLPEPPEDRSEELAAALRTMLGHVAAARAVRFDASQLHEKSLDQLVRLSASYFTK